MERWGVTRIAFDSRAHLVTRSVGNQVHYAIPSLRLFGSVPESPPQSVPQVL